MSSNRLGAQERDAARLALVRESEHDMECDPSDPYVADAAGATTSVTRLTKRQYRVATDPAVLLNDLLEIAESEYAPFLTGMTRRNKARSDAPSFASAKNGALGRELRPAFVRRLDRAGRHPIDPERAIEVIKAALDAMRAVGVEEAKWAVVTNRRFLFGLTHKEIARELGCGRSTVTEYLQKAEGWIRAYAREQDWIAAYLYTDTSRGDAAVARYHIRDEHEKKTPEQWLATADFAHITVMDPDGWDCAAPDGPAGWNAPLSREEFEQRLMRSTIGLTRR